MIFIYELDPYFMEIYHMFKYELSISRRSKLSPESQIDRHDRIYIHHTASVK